MKTYSNIIIAGLCLAPAITLAADSDPSIEKYVRMVQVQIDLGEICQNVIDGTISPAEATKQILELKERSKEVIENIKSMLEDIEAAKKDSLKFHLSERGKSMRVEFEKVGPRLEAAAAQIKDEAFIMALGNFFL